MLNTDTLALIYAQLDLESCIQFSQVCSLTRHVFQALNDTLIRNQVLKRAPWFGCDDNQEWTQLARVLVNRSKKSLDPAHKHLYLLKNLEVAVSLGQNDMDILKTVPGETGGREQLFEDASDSEDNLEFTEEVVLDGFVIRHENPHSQIRVYDSNSLLVHVRILTEDQYEDTILYKTGHDLVITSKTPTYPSPTRNDQNKYNNDGNIVSLLPGVAGALVLYTRYDRQHVVYVEPSPLLSCVLVCSVPATACYSTRYDQSDSWFYTCYNGYLYLYFEGHFVRLWIDLGYRTKLSISSSIDATMIPMMRTRCLVVWDRNFPILGGLQVDVGGGHTFGVIRSDANPDYVSCAGSCGTAFASLKNGKTYFCMHEYLEHTTVPFINQGRIHFGVFSLDGHDAVQDAHRDDLCLLSHEDKTFKNEDRNLNEEYPWSEDEEAVERKRDQIVEEEVEEESDDEERPLWDVPGEEWVHRKHWRYDDVRYDDAFEYNKPQEVVSDPFLRNPEKVRLNPTTMNSTKGFRRAENVRKNVEWWW